MNDKTQMIALLRGEFDRWEVFLASMTEEEIIAPGLPANWSIKDVVAHLWAWQQLSTARLEAALLNKDPVFSMWPSHLDPESDDDIDGINAWIYKAFHEQPWSSVHRDWREGFLRFLRLAQRVPEKDLVDPGKYRWLDGLPLSAVLLGSYEHHHEDHLEPLLGREDRNRQA